MNTTAPAQPRGLITSTITLLFDPKGRVKDSTTVEQFTPITRGQRPPRMRSPQSLPLFRTPDPPHRATESLAQELKALAQLFFKRQPRPNARKQKAVRDSKEENASWARLMTGCRDLKRELAGQLSEAENSITLRKGEWEEAKNYCEEVQSRGPWKTNKVYTKKRTWLQKQLREKPDPNRDLDREIVLGVASPTTRKEGQKRYVSLEELTPGRLDYISKVTRRGFGNRPLALEQLITNFESLRTPPASMKRWDSQSSDTQELGCRSTERFDTEPADSHYRFDSFGSGSPVNEFISRQQHRFIRSPVSRVTVAKKRAVEAAMNRIRSSPDIAFRVQQIEEEANKKRLKFLRAQTGQTSFSTRQGHKASSSQLFPRP